MRASDNLRKRLEALNRGPLPPPSGPPPDGDPIRRRLQKKVAAEHTFRTALAKEDSRQAGAEPLPRQTDARGAPSASASPQAEVVLEQALPGTEIEAPHGGKLYLIEVDTAQLDVVCQSSVRGFRAAVEENGTLLHRRVARLTGAPAPGSSDVIFLDLETTGLGSAPLFLIGTATWDSGQMAIRQYLARNYAEERAVLSLFFDHLAPKRLLITFNGKSYDWPFLRMRSIYHGVPCPAEPPHLDLIHPARRRWRCQLPDCRLSTLETLVCGRPRGDDIPGSEIPEAYHAFVRTGNAAQMVQIVRHNLHDLVTMADLALRLFAEPGAPPSASGLGPSPTGS